METGVSHSLQKKTLKALASFMNISEAKVLYLMFQPEFNDENNPDINDLTEGFHKRYLIQEYASYIIANNDNLDISMEGGSEKPFFYVVNSKDNRIRRLILSLDTLELSEKPNANEVLGASIIYASKAKKHYDRLMEVWIVFHSKNNLDLQIYDEMKKMIIRVSKPAIKVVLFDPSGKKELGSYDLTNPNPLFEYYADGLSD